MADTSSHSQAALREVVHLASMLRAKLEALFREDINLIRLAGLPFHHSFHPVAESSGEVDLKRLERALKRQAEEVRRLLESLAEPSRVRYSFRIVRGSVASELFSASLDSDLVTAGWVGLGVGIRSRPVSTTSSHQNKSESV